MADFDSEEEPVLNAPAFGDSAAEGADAAAPDASTADTDDIQKENAVLLDQVPEAARKFIVQLHAALSTSNLSSVTTLYERTYGQLTNEYFKAEEWPRAELKRCADEVFLTFYRELYFRHLYSRFSQNIDIEDRFDSYENYCNLFNYLLNSEGPVPVELPNQWLWDIIDEFLWQFGSYSAWRARVRERNSEELEMLHESPQVWSAYSVLNVLYSLVQKSKISDQLRTLRQGDELDAAHDDFGAKPLYRMLGYFSLLGLLRVHVLLGDYTLALKVMDDVDIRTMASAGGRLHSVHAAHVSAFSYVGFAFLSLRRYGDAIDFLSRGISHFYKHRRFTAGAEQISKQVDRMLGLVAVAHALLPSHRLEDWVKQGIAEKFADQHARMQRGSWEVAGPVFEELWLRACPKFVSPVPIPLPEPGQPPEPTAAADASFDTTRHQLTLFLTEAKVRSDVVPDMRSLLKLYTTLSTSKLSDLTAAEGRGEGDALCDLTVVKGAMRDLRWQDGSLLSGEQETAGDLGFGIDGDIVTITETRRPRQYADYFLRRGLKTEEAYLTLKAKPLSTRAI